jgi:hypothetical protein
MEKNPNWKRVIAGIILITVVTFFGTAIIIPNIEHLSGATIASAIAFASVVTYIISKFL